MSILHAVAWACMLFAAFGDREPQASTNPFGQQFNQPSGKPPINETH
jgi:hypothetical protein